MIVLMTSSTPKRERRTAAIAAQPCTANSRSDERERHDDHCRQTAERERHRCTGRSSRQQLAFRADVQDACTKGDRHSDSGEHQRNGTNQRRGGERIPGSQRPTPQRRQPTVDGVSAGEQEECRRADDREHHESRPRQLPGDGIASECRCPCPALHAAPTIAWPDPLAIERQLAHDALEDDEHASREEKHFVDVARIHHDGRAIDRGSAESRVYLGGRLHIEACASGSR